MRQINDPIIPIQAAASINSAAIPSLNLFSCSLQIVATGGASGTLNLQASNDDPVNPAVNPPTNFSTIATISVSGNGVFMIPKTDLCYQYIRASYTNTGTGIISVILKALGE